MEKIALFRRKVYRFFKQEGRILPWRTDYNAYYVLVSEIMLQQTQVNRVVDKFDRFIKFFPSITILAESSLEEVLKAWQGLGYNRRANLLRKAAKRIVDEFDGVIPDDPAVLVTLPGIGSATAASIAAFAYNKPTVFLETNIRTVFIHHFFRGCTSISDEKILAVAQNALDRKNPRKWYSALMDYGTTLKTQYGNLTRKSTAYKKQSRFQGSKRQLRGMILKEMISAGGGTAARIAASVDRDAQSVALQLEALTADGLLVKNRGRYRIAK